MSNEEVWSIWTRTCDAEFCRDERLTCPPRVSQGGIGCSGEAGRLGGPDPRLSIRRVLPPRRGTPQRQSFDPDSV